MTGRTVIIFFAVSVLGLGGVFVPQAEAKRSILQILFPYQFPVDEEELDGGRAVEKTLQAPFVSPEPDKENQQQDEFDKLYDPTGSAALGSELAKPHRHHEQIGIWLSKAVAESLTVEPNNFAEHLKNLSETFNPEALQQYRNFMEQSRTLNSLQSNQLKLTSLQEKPLLLNQATLGGRYRWLFEIPVTLTFLPANLKSYENHTPITHKVTIRVQVGRIAAEEGGQDIIVESFDVTRAREE